MSSDTAKGAQGEASSAKGPAPQPSLITPVDDGSNPVYAVELPIFEGPLDLLLHLVRRHELDILDIPIAFVTEKYLEYLEVMRALDIEIAGDYLVMAATLAYLKSRELVPQQDAEEEESDGEDEDGEDPREALIRRLIEYERFRAAGRELNEMPVAGRDVFTRGGSIDLPPLDPGMAPVTLFRLAEAYARVLQRAKISKSHEVVIERVTVRQRMEQLSLILEERGDVEFDSLFLEREWSSVLELRQMLVVTLMSVLELVKLGIIGVQQPTDTATIRLLRRASYAAAMQALTGYDEDASFGEGAAPKPGAPTPAGGAAAAGVAPQPPPAAPASGSPVARDGDAALGPDDAASAATRARVDGAERGAVRSAAGRARPTDDGSAESIEASEALADPEEDVEDEPELAFAADDAAESRAPAERGALAEPEDELEDGPGWRVVEAEDSVARHGPPFADDVEDSSELRAVESDGLVESEALAEPEGELEDGPNFRAFEAEDSAERHGPPSEDDAEDRSDSRASTTNDAVESEGLAESEGGVEDRSEMSAFAEDDAVEIESSRDREAPAEREGDVEDGSDWGAFEAHDAAVSDGPPEGEAFTDSGADEEQDPSRPPEGASEAATREDEVPDGADWSALAADGSAENDLPPRRDAPAGSGASSDGADGDATGWGAAASESEAATLSALEDDVEDRAGWSAVAEATSDGGLTAGAEPVPRGSERPLADAMGDDAGGPPEGLAQGRGEPREAGWIPAAIDEGEQTLGEEWTPEPPANEAARAARVDSEAPTADDNTRDGPSPVDGGEDPRESDE